MNGYVQVSFDKRNRKLAEFEIKNPLVEEHERVKKEILNAIEGENERLGD